MANLLGIANPLLVCYTFPTLYKSGELMILLAIFEVVSVVKSMDNTRLTMQPMGYDGNNPMPPENEFLWTSPPVGLLDLTIDTVAGMAQVSGLKPGDLYSFEYEPFVA